MSVFFSGIRDFFTTVLILVTAFTLCASSAQAQTQQNSPSAHILSINGAIGPAVADYIVRGIDLAGKNKAELIIIMMDTPGGLSNSMREIIKAIVNSGVPVATFVAPSGARAASAGTYISYASHISAMAPGTNIGAATPISIGISSSDKDENSGAKKDTKGNPIPTSTSDLKSRNDAVAYIKSLAELHGRNVDWAEDAVRKASSLSAEEALSKNVIDLIAKDVPQLMQKVNGREIKVEDKNITLATSNITLEHKDPDWRSKFLSVITDPSFAYLLLLVGFYGLFIEFTTPGMILPGVIGVIAFLLSMYGFAMLPINYVGLLLIFLGLGAMISEMFFISHGVLGVGGVIAFIIGSVMLIDVNLPAFQIALWLIVSVSIVTVIFVVTLINMALRSRSRPVLSGAETILGKEAKVISIEDDVVNVRIGAETWEASSDQPVSVGQKVIIVSISGLTLKVTPKSQS